MFLFIVGIIKHNKKWPKQIKNTKTLNKCKKHEKYIYITGNILLHRYPIIINRRIMIKKYMSYNNNASKIEKSLLTLICVLIISISLNKVIIYHKHSIDVKSKY